MATYYAKSLKNKAKSTLLYTRNPLFKSAHRPSKCLFNNIKTTPTLKRGYPVFNLIFDTLNQKASGLRRYRNRIATQPAPKVYEIDKCDDMNHRFRFEIQGSFNAQVFESELQSHCNQLNLVGWIKCRNKFATGHLQGNVIATSLMKRWMEICATRHAKFTGLRIFDENYAMPQLDYSCLDIVRDYRKPRKKAQQQRQQEARQL